MITMTMSCCVDPAPHINQNMRGVGIDAFRARQNSAAGIRGGQGNVVVNINTGTSSSVNILHIHNIQLGLEGQGGSDVTNKEKTR